jgi:hypothetical protein
VRLDGSRSRSRPGRIVDPLTARGIFTPGRLFDLPLAAAGYLSRNHRHATGTIRDHEAPTLALSCVLVSIDIRRLALLDGWSVAQRWGRVAGVRPAAARHCTGRLLARPQHRAPGREGAPDRPGSRRGRLAVRRRALALPAH